MQVKKYFFLVCWVFFRYAEEKQKGFTMKDFILASSSPQRKQLLLQIDYEPKAYIPADIDETPLTGENAQDYVQRMAKSKALAVAAKNPDENVLACDTMIVCDGDIIQKSPTNEAQRAVMERLSGRSHFVMSAVCLIDKKGNMQQFLSKTEITTKKLSEKELTDYVESRDWYGCCGYRIEGLMGGFVEKINGSYSGVIGLPLCETKQMLDNVL